MKSRTTRTFWRLLDALPDEVQDHARLAYEQFQSDRSHPGLRFKKVSDEDPLYSARIGRSYRALGRVEGETITWFWIGSHDEYIRMLRG